MRNELTNNAKTLSLHAGINRKKLVLAIGLLGVMAMMWVRVFVSGSDPVSVANAAAQEAMQHEDVVQEKCVKLEFHSLESIDNRHDTLARDVFDKSKWGEDKRDSGGGEPIVCSREDANSRLQEDVDDAVTSLELNAIFPGKHPEVYIGEEFYHIGDVVKFRHKESDYALEVTYIDSELVRFSSEAGELEAEIKIAQ